MQEEKENKPQQPRKKIKIGSKVYRKLEKCARNKSMTVQQYVDFLFRDWSRNLTPEETEKELNVIFKP